MHKVYFDLLTIDDWYTIISELKRWFGNEWHGQRGIRKKFKRTDWMLKPQRVWFLIPDPAFKTFVDLKMTNNLKLK